MAFSGSGMYTLRWNRWVVVSGACVVGGAALWWYLRKQSITANDDDASRDKSTMAADFTPVFRPDLRNSKAAKDRGNKYFKECQFDEAVDAFTEAMELCPVEHKSHLAVCYQNRAAAYDRLKDPKRSIADCTKALQLDPLYFKAVLRRGRAYLLQNNPEKALDDFTYASLVKPDEAEVLKADIDSSVTLASANLVEHLKSTRESIPVRDELVFIWRNSYVNDPVLHDLKKKTVCVSPYHQALEAIRQRHYEEVIQLIEDDLYELQSERNHLNFSYMLRDHILLARFALMKENIRSVKDHLVAFDNVWKRLDEHSKSELNNKRFRSMYHILLAAWKFIEHLDDVKSVLKLAIEIDRTNVDAYVGAALLLAENGQIQEAIEYLDKLEEVDPTHHLVKHMKANCEVALKASIGDAGGAIACMAKVDQLIQMNKNANPMIYLSTGRLYYAAQNKDLAKALLAKAAETISDCAAPIFYLAMVEAEEMEGSPNQLTVLESKMKLCLEREKANPDALAILAKIAFQRQQFEEALSLYEQCIAVCPLLTSQTSLLPAVTDYVQIRSLCRAVKALHSTTLPPNILV